MCYVIHGYILVQCYVVSLSGDGMLVAVSLKRPSVLRGWQRGGHDPVSRTNFNKIHASRTVLTKFHESRNST